MIEDDADGDGRTTKQMRNARKKANAKAKAKADKVGVEEGPEHIKETVRAPTPTMLLNHNSTKADQRYSQTQVRPVGSLSSLANIHCAYRILSSSLVTSRLRLLRYQSS